MQIGVVAKRVGLSVDAVRYYERNGLLPHPPRTEGGFRRYAERHQEVLVRDEGMAKELKFSGSPTIRVNGRDVAGETESAGTFALSCRLYPGSEQAGLPTAEMVHRAVVEAVKSERL